ncbi:alkaline phosphatase PhoX [Streptomyces sp. TRM70308]|uniref:PhoX family protein n=1 Tax=Streptomyces sp. TRM70308 TaxID=3131932 RepID=UPI003CFDAF1A
MRSASGAEERPRENAPDFGTDGSAEPERSRVTRRALLATGAAGLLALAAPPALASAPAPARRADGRDTGRLGFRAVAPDDRDELTVPEGYTAEVLAPWGAPLLSTGPRWRPDGRHAALDQAHQVGTHHHGLELFPEPDGRRGLLAIGHEAVDAAQLTGGLAQALAAQGVTIAAVAERGGRWSLVDSAHSRRTTGTTPVRFAGPVGADHPWLRTGQPPRGVLASGGGGATPWGTYLACEEKVNSWFGTDDAEWERTEAQARYGLSAAGFGAPWHREDARFDLAATPGEAQRHGWVVEIDPRRPGAAPVKRTALGRFLHAGATVTQSRGRVVVYSADAEDGEYVYKFVGDRPWRQVRAEGADPLDHGRLYVARFSADGTGRWLPLAHGTGPLVRAAGWQDQADVLVRARMAADALGATGLPRPERLAAGPSGGEVYLALAGGAGGGACCADAGGADQAGRVRRWREAVGDAAAESFTWEEFAVGGESDRDPAGRPDQGDLFAAPKDLALDPGGRLWISTGISGYLLHRAETGHERFGTNALLAADPGTGEVRRFLTSPRGAEITGVTASPDGRALFVNVQHPGEAGSRWGTPGSDRPDAVSSWPDRRGGRPRSATVVVRRADGGVVGA